MHAFVMSDIGIGQRERVSDPTPGPGEVIIAPTYSGLCGTDVHMFNEGALTRHEALPVIMGHEFVGTIVALGDTDQRRRDIDNPIRIGDNVAVEPMLPCGLCAQCVQGRLNLCANWPHLGILENGCWADYVRVPMARLTTLPEGVSPYGAALAEPLACAVNFVVHRGQLTVGESVLILGAGPVGLLSISMAKAAGAGLIIVSEPHENRRHAARNMGADIAIDPLSNDLADLVRTATRGSGIDLIVEATGSKTAVAQSITVAKPGSRIVLSGLGAAGTTPLDVNAVVTKELTVLGGFASRWAMKTGLSAIAAGHVKTDQLVTSIRNWSDAELAMQDMLTDPDTCKILFQHTAH